MRIALDATYSVDPHPSGIGVYSHEILNGLAGIYPDHQYLWCYRWKQWRRVHALPANVRRRLFQPPLPTIHADLFHALNQRVDRRPAKRVLSTFHDLFVLTGDYSSTQFKQRFAEQARQAAQNSDLIVAVSEFTAQQVTGLLGVDRSRIRVVPHGVHLPAVPASEERENIILSIGALQLRKNLLRVVEAFETLADGWRLVLGGAPTGYRVHEILSRIEASPARDRIQITGYLSPQELSRLYWKAKIFAFPSLDEGFGMPILEAMAHGVPVITSTRSAMPEVAGQAGLLVDPTRTEELQQALQRLTQDENLRNELIEAGYARAALFSWDRAIRETYAVYQELL